MIATTGTNTPNTICHFWLNPERELSPPLLLPELLVVDCEGFEAVDEEFGTEVVLAPFETGVVCGVEPTGATASGVPTATAMLEEPAETVVVDVVPPPPPSSKHSKPTAVRPIGPAK